MNRSSGRRRVAPIRGTAVVALLGERLHQVIANLSDESSTTDIGFDAGDARQLRGRHVRFTTPDCKVAVWDLSVFVDRPPTCAAKRSVDSGVRSARRLLRARRDGV